jgi:hypothetical protein
LLIFTALVGLAPDAPIETIDEPQAVQVATSSKEWIKQRIIHYAEIYGVSWEVMDFIVKCESNYNPNAIGDNGHSFGLVQIHLMSWIDAGVDYGLATDPEFALDFLARKLKSGDGHLWTCYRLMGESVVSE